MRKVIYHSKDGLAVMENMRNEETSNNHKYGDGLASVSQNGVMDIRLSMGEQICASA